MRDSAAFIVIGAFVLLLLGTLLSDWSARNDERCKAIKAGVGRWVSDRSTGNTEFKYGAKP